MKTSVTQMILNSRSNKFITRWDYVPSLIANIFSVFFASTIILELRGTVDNYVLYVMASFIIIFLVWNEITKVSSVRKYFKGHKSSLYPIIITFIISITLASIGIYFFTNKSITITNDSTIQKSIEITNLKTKYNTQISELNSKSFEFTTEYDALNKELKYWKTRTASSLEDRNDIRNKVAVLQTQIQKSRDIFTTDKNVQISSINDLLKQEIEVVNNKYNRTLSNTQKNNFITYIFLILIIVTEISTILLNKKVAEKLIQKEQFLNSDMVNDYLLTRKIFFNLYINRNQSTNMITLNKARNTNIGQSIEFETLKNHYNTLITIGVLEGFKEILMNKFLVEEHQGLSLIDNYYDKLFYF